MRLIDQIKSEIDLVNFALLNGFQLDKAKTSKSCKVFRGPVGKIGVSYQDGKWVYFNFDKERGGSIVDLVMDLQGKTFREALSILEPEIENQEQVKLDPIYTVLKSSFNRKEVTEELKSLIVVERTNSYLHSRNISSQTLSAKRFHRTIYTDQYKNAVFPHYDQKGFTGAEKRNMKFWGFSEFGKKTVWFSRSQERDNALLFSESALDCLSYYQVKDDGITRYFSIGGNLSNDQLEIIDLIMKKNPDKIKKLAFDNDKDGHKYVKKFCEKWPDEDFIIDLPKNSGDDWTDISSRMVSF